MKNKNSSNNSDKIFINNWFYCSFIFGLFIFVSLTSCTKDPVTGGGGGGTGGGGSNPLAERIILDTAFGTNPLQKMDVYLPAGRTSATKIIVLDEGKIIQQGTHNELVNSEGYYKELYAKQLLEKEM